MKELTQEEKEYIVYLIEKYQFNAEGKTASLIDSILNKLEGEVFVKYDKFGNLVRVSEAIEK